MGDHIRTDVAIIDADFAIKAAWIKKYNVIEEIISEFIETLYIHRYVYENEVYIPPAAKQQINNLIKIKKAVVVDREYIYGINPTKEVVYEGTITLLEKLLKDSE